MNVAVHLTVAQREVLRALRAAGATTRDGATLYEGRDPFQEQQLRALVRTGDVVEVEPGRYYVDEAAIGTRSLAARRTAVFAAVVLSGAALLAAALRWVDG